MLFWTRTWCTTRCWTWIVTPWWWSVSSWTLCATSSCYCRHHHLGCQCGSIYCTNVHAEYIYQISLPYVHYMLCIQVESWPYVLMLTEFTHIKCIQCICWTYICSLKYYMFLSYLLPCIAHLVKDTSLLAGDWCWVYWPPTPSLCRAVLVLQNRIHLLLLVQFLH